VEDEEEFLAEEEEEFPEDAPEAELAGEPADDVVPEGIADESLEDILATRPMPNQTEVELLSKPLDSEDRPRPGDVSDGRLIVTTQQFLDPAVYAAGRRMTVIATVTGEEERKIAELPYRYPVVEAESIKLWPREVIVPAYPPPWPYFYAWPYPYGWR
jgi:outer membrane lipoprotein